MRHPRALTTLALAVIIGASLALSGQVLAALRLSGAGNCGNFFTDTTAAQPGDVLTPMRGFVSTSGAIISKTLVVQGGWIPATGDCTTSGTSNFTSRAAMIAAGFAFDPTQRSELGGDGVSSILRVNLTSGQTAVLENLDMSFYNFDLNGNAISGTLDNGARLRLDNLSFEGNQSGVNAIGGAIYIEVRGGSQLVIANSTFTNNNAISGGAVEVRLFDNSSLLVEGNTFTNNEALSSNGGALRVEIESGTVTLRNNTFTNNRAINGSGGAVAVERNLNTTGRAFWASEGNVFSGNSASASNDTFSSPTVPLLGEKTFLPMLRKPASSSGFGVAITGITMSDAQYRVTFTTSGFTPVMPGRHVHFFFNTVPPAKAGLPGSGPWFMYGSSAPFTGYGIINRPAGATQLCSLVANSNHSVIQGTGNCVSLP